MQSEVKYTVYYKENIYFWIKVLFSILLYPTIVLILVGLFDSEDQGKVSLSLMFYLYVFNLSIYIYKTWSFNRLY